MKIFQILTIAALSLIAVSCGNKKESEQSENRYEEKTNDISGVSSTSSYSDSDNITINDKEYNYTYDFHSVDSLPHITYPSGSEYMDNAVSLNIKRDGEDFVQKTFTKASFKSYIPEKLYETSGLIGFAYNIERQMTKTFDALYFIITIGSLEDTEEIAYPLEVRIDTDGGMTVKKYEYSETEPLRDDLNIDPSEE